jgi:hypothetical protein
LRNAGLKDTKDKPCFKLEYGQVGPLNQNPARCCIGLAPDSKG